MIPHLSRHYLGYVAISAVALALDTGVFMGLLAAHAPSLAAATSGYLAGAVLHWWLSTRSIFADRTAHHAAERRRQLTLYVASGALGLGVTAATMATAGWAQLDPRLGKLAAIGLSFNAVYAMRRWMVFRAPLIAA